MTETERVVDEIKAERHRQVHDEAWTPAHDDGHGFGELARAAATYALQSTLNNPESCLDVEISGGTTQHKRKFFTVGTINVSYLLWPWEGEAWKPSAPRRDLVKAAALIIAEIERLDRANQGSDQQE